MKKRIIFLLLICFSWFYTYAAVTDEEVLINGIYYSLYSDGSAAVTSGPDFGSYAGCVKIPSAVTYQGKKYAVTCIGAESFVYCQNLTSVSIPSSVELIGFNAFNGCSALSSVTISEGVTKIKNQAFYGCGSLRIVELPSTITEVGAYAFSDCKQLTKIILPQRTKLGEGVVDGCPSELVWSYYLPTGNDKEYDFKSGNLYYNITSSSTVEVTYQTDDGNNYDGFVNVTIPASVINNSKTYTVTAIGHHAFANCLSLQSVKLPNTIEVINEEAFFSCGFPAIDIPNSVKNIGDRAFGACFALTSITIPKTLENISNSAFSYCTSLKTIIMPEKWENILPKDAFANCSAAIIYTTSAKEMTNNNTLCQGALPGVFTVGGGKKVRFSQGNLQYTQSTKTWSFAAHQYDMIGYGNVTGGTIKSDQYGKCKKGNALADKIDMFGWSGSTAVAKWGVSTSRDSSYYSGDFADWGQNAISNGGNKANQWRTLTYAECIYLIKYRPNASSLQGVASVNGVNGLILLPDAWKQPTGISFKSGFAETISNTAYGAYQSFTSSEWQRMESAGAVFLPASSCRGGTAVCYVNYPGYYWTASLCSENDARYLYFLPSGTGMDDNNRIFGFSVRLVQDVK